MVQKDAARIDLGPAREIPAGVWTPTWTYGTSQGYNIAEYTTRSTFKPWMVLAYNRIGAYNSDQQQPMLRSNVWRHPGCIW
jgi:hypothetical protein